MENQVDVRREAILAMDAVHIEPDESICSNGEAGHATQFTSTERHSRILLHGLTGKQMEDEWPAPDIGVLRLHRRPPPKLPIECFGEAWGKWIMDAAEAASCPADFVSAPLLAITSALIGNARWPQAIQGGWKEPPHLWTGVVGDSGDGKSPRKRLPDGGNRSGAREPDECRFSRSVARMASYC